MVNSGLCSLTHEVEEAYISDRVIVMEEGKVVYEGKPDEVFSNREVREKYKLQTPFLVSLKEELKDSGFDVDKLNSVEEVIKYLCR